MFIIREGLGPSEDDATYTIEDRTSQVMYPKAARDADGIWHFVLNKEENPIQGFKVEICDPNSKSCSNIIFTQRGYGTSCKQKYAYRKMAVLHDNGTTSDMALNVPSCCACVAHTVLV